MFYMKFKNFGFTLYTIWSIIAIKIKVVNYFVVDQTKRFGSVSAIVRFV